MSRLQDGVERCLLSNLRGETIIALPLRKMRKGISEMNLIEQARKYKDGASTIAAWLGSGAVTVPLRQAQERANVCLKCPMNVHTPVIDRAIALAIRKQVELKGELQLRVSGEKSLNTCQGCGCVLRLKIWLPLERLGVDESELGNFAGECWMRKEYKQKHELP